jgi:hypothetical protein
MFRVYPLPTLKNYMQCVLEVAHKTAGPAFVGARFAHAHLRYVCSRRHFVPGFDQLTHRIAGAHSKEIGHSFSVMSATG